MSERPVIDADHLPTGEDKARAVRAMFDAIAPRYDLVNRIMTFRMDVGWRRRTVRDLRLGPGRPCSTWRAAPATCVVS
ncbi:MAG: class I SAM-dependent methyltransferase [Acidimicrobiales bacterium]